MTTPVTRKLRQLGLDTQYVLLGLPLAVLTISLLLALFLTGVGTLLIWIGLPILVATMLVARGFATLERLRLEAVLGAKVPHPDYRRPKAPGLWGRVTAPLTDGQSWLDLLHGVFRIVPATVAFAFVVAWWVAALAELTFPLWGWSIPNGPDDMDLPELIGLGDSIAVRTVFHLLVGVFFALTLYPVVRTVTLMEAKFAQVLLSRFAELNKSVRQARDERDTAQAQTVAAVSAEAIALRRLERDIHDGPQQRLVRLAMDLGRAEQQFATDPAAARATVAEALTQTRETLDELRALSRGIAPPILVDRGLQAALTALAGRCTIPVDLDATVVRRLDPRVETTAYFVVAEALTNIAKHSNATEAQVGVQLETTGLVITVADDGVGGASLDKGHGLAGLDDRVRSAGGVLHLDSATGQGTRLTVALPV